MATRNVIFEITNAEEGSEFEWIFDNGTTSFTLEGGTIGTNFEEFGPTWAANPNSDVTLTIRAKNACGYGTNTIFIISAARFKAINDQDCDIYLQKRTTPQTEIDNLICYPNPSNKLITVLKPTHLIQGELKIYNTIGKIIITQIVNSDITIHTENWQQGIYYLYLTDGSLIFSTKIEIKK
ncbi:MAG: T9SS type A sorting domain-containing protein [Bacteroidia bacterium]|nr:T9SS type A sorting domain-containing protein [Bacteroidia bacterium]